MAGTGDRNLREAVISAVSEWRFRPTDIKGTPALRTVIVPFSFVRGVDSDSFVPGFVQKERQKS
jgi:hypothetical protein